MEDTVGRKCVCNGLLANLGMPQVRKDGAVELPMFTSGDDVANVARFLAPGASSYAAKDVVEYLLAGVSEASAEATAGAAEPTGESA